MNPFLTCFLSILAVIGLVWLSGKYQRYVDANKENDDDLDLFC